MTKNKTILIVDDVEDVRDGLASVLGGKNYSTIVAHDGISALESLKYHAVDLVITDILMPNMDGIELITKAKLEYPEIGFILISGGGQSMINPGYDYLRTCKKLTGEDMVLKKPFNPETLIKMVNTYFSERDAK